MAQLPKLKIHSTARLTHGMTELVGLAGLALLAVALGWIIARFEGFGAAPAEAVLAVLAGSLAVTIIANGPVACLAVITGLTAGGFNVPIGQAAGADIAIADVFYAGLLGWWVFGSIAPRRASSSEPRPDFGQRMALLFLGYAALTLLTAQIANPGDLGDPLVSWLRLAQTASLAWLAAWAIRGEKDIVVVLATVAAAVGVSIAVALIDGGDLLGGRPQGGTLNPNALGLVAGFMLLVAVFAGITRRRGIRLLVGGAAVVGLILAKSVASFVATGFALILGASLLGRRTTDSTNRVARAALAATLVGLLTFSVVQQLRPEAVPGSENFRIGSASHRIILVAAGVEVFQRHPVFGAGWRRTSDPDLIGDREIATELRQRFPDAPPRFFPDITPASVHNTYVQVLAELGLVGMALLIGLVVTLAMRIRELFRRLDRDHALWLYARVLTLGLVLILIWMNDNPLFGGQPETVLAAVLVGSLAALARMTGRTEPSQGER